MTTSPRLVHTPSPGTTCRSFNAGTEVVYADFTPTPVVCGIAWVRRLWFRGEAVLVSAADLSVAA